MRIARLWLVGTLVVALTALGPGVAWAGLTSSVGTLAGDALGQSSAPSDDEDDDSDDDDGDDDDGGGGGQDRAFCAPEGPPERGQCLEPNGDDFDFDASSGPLGENPTGSGLDHFGARVSYDVTCLQVIGNHAAIGGRMTSGPFVGSGVAFTVLDNSPAPDTKSHETFQLVPPLPSTPNCGAVFEPFFPVGGNIVVQDNVGAGGGGEDDDDDGDDGDDGNDG